MSNTVYLKNYQPPHFTVESIFLDIDLHEESVLVTNHMCLQRLQDGPLFLYGEVLELVSIALEGVLLQPDEYVLAKEGLFLHQDSSRFNLTIVTRIYPQKNTKLSGLFRSHALFCTQCEAEGFRRITYFLDRPDVLTTYTTKITADKAKYPVLLSNGNLMDTGEVSPTRHWALWQDPFKKPSYLFALVAGNLACIADTFVTCSGKEVQLKIYVEPGQEDKCDHAMASLKKAMRWDEEVYGREYDLSIFMIVAVSDFNMGAMENKGLNIFNSKYILARPDTATDQDFMGVESVIAHEYFHNWTGNRVTCRDWFQLSLKEGLTVFRDQEFSRDMNSREVNRIQDVKVLRTVQFPEDAGSMAHPVRPAAYQEINNFYTATIYNKGAEVIRMQHTLLGEKGFKKGMDLYFARHDGQAVTIDEFVAAMEDANQVDFTQLKLWYSQAGTPEIQVKTDFRENSLYLTLSQSCLPTPEAQIKQPFLIPIKIALFNETGESLAIEKEVLVLDKAVQTFEFSNLKHKPLISLLRDFSAPVKLHAFLTEAELIALLRYETNGYAKWDCAQKLAKSWILHRLKDPTHLLPQALIQAFNHVLVDEKLDKQLRAELLTPPSYEEIIADLTSVDPVAIEQARDAYRQQLGLGLFSAAQQAYIALWKRKSNSIQADAIGDRKLRNTCLWFMMKSNESASLDQCIHQFKASLTMSDQLASYALLCNSANIDQQEAAITDFYNQWSQDELVMDKWFAMQAASEHSATLGRIKQLLKHKNFSITNPNKVRALIGTFIQSNMRNFHHISGEGYQFLTQIVLELDAINPQVAARMAMPFTRWKCLDKQRQLLMKAQLDLLMKHQLSRDLQEIVQKSLVS